MDANKFAKKIAKLEGGRRQMDIAQIKEVLKWVNHLTYGALYNIIRLMKD